MVEDESVALGAQPRLAGERAGVPEAHLGRVRRLGREQHRRDVGFQLEAGDGVAAAEVEATIKAVHSVAATLKPLGKAVIINAGARLSQDPSAALVPFPQFFERFDDIENIIW